MIIGSKKRLSQVSIDPEISVGDFEIKKVVTTKSLGLMIDWSAQVAPISRKVSSGLAIIRLLGDVVEFNTLMIIYQSIVQPYFRVLCSSVGLPWKNID